MNESNQTEYPFLIDTIIFSYPHMPVHQRETTEKDSKMNLTDNSTNIKEIMEYIRILSQTRLIAALPENTLSELQRILGSAVSMIQHMEAGED